MAANPTNPTNSKTGPETPKETPVAETPAPTGGGIKPWLPLIANIVLMPVLAYGTVTFMILPKMSVNRHVSSSEAGTPAKASQPERDGKQKVAVPLSAKVLVNVAGTMGTRYLLANITLVGTNAELKALAEKNDAEMRDAAASALSIKTINDLEKPGARNLIRAELISVFNNILGQGVITDIYLTEFAIQ